MKELAQHIIIRVLLLAGILVISAFIYNRYVYPEDLKKYSPFSENINSLPGSFDVLYVAESSNITYADDDENKRKISEMIDDLTPGISVKDLSHRAAHAGVYKVIIGALPESKRFKTLVVTMNLRSFGADWIHSGLETVLQKEMVLLRQEQPIVKRFMLSFKDYENKSEDVREKEKREQWRNEELNFPYPFPYATTDDWDGAMGLTGTFTDGQIDSKTGLACGFIKSYGWQIDTLTNPRIQDFNEIVEIANDRGWNLVFNLMAENVEKAETLVGKDLVYLMEYNRKLLAEYYTRKGVVVVDNLDIIENKYFIDQTWTTEHYTEEGRMRIAEQVKDALMKYHDISE